MNLTFSLSLPKLLYYYTCSYYTAILQIYSVNRKLCYIMSNLFKRIVSAVIRNHTIDKRLLCRFPLTKITFVTENTFYKSWVSNAASLTSKNSYNFHYVITLLSYGLCRKIRRKEYFVLTFSYGYTAIVKHNGVRRDICHHCKISIY